MATRSTIAVQHNDNSITQIYCHWDGYLDNNGKLLQEHYNTQEQVEALVALGSISSLNKSIECPVGHSFNQPVKGYTVAYHRDRGEDFVLNKFKDWRDYFVNSQEEEYNYIFREGQWFVKYNSTDNEYIPLTEAFEREAAAQAE